MINEFLELLFSRDRNSVELATMLYESQGFDLEYELNCCRKLLGKSETEKLKIRDFEIRLVVLSRLQIKNYLPDCTQLPIVLGYLGDLEELDLSSLPIPELPKTLERLEKLETLILCETHLKSLPDWISSFQNLRTLYFERSKIEKLPLSFGRLQGLEELYMADSPMLSFPDGMAPLRSVHVLRVGVEQLQRLFTTGQGARIFPALDRIQVAGEQINQLPNALLKLDYLDYLELPPHLDPTNDPVIAELKQRPDMRIEFTSKPYTPF